MVEGQGQDIRRSWWNLTPRGRVGHGVAYYKTRGGLRSYAVRRIVILPHLENDMKCEIIFCSSSTPKKCKNVDAIYTKGDMLIIQYKDGLIIRYPLINIFSVANYHGKHLGSTR